MSIELQVVLNSFRAWMNRPVKRVHVYTWSMACALFNDSPLATFRCLPAYRTEAAKVARREIARIIKQKKRIGAVRLPVYNEATENYLN